MSVNKVISETGEVSWIAYANCRSTTMPHIRFQRRVRLIKSHAEALRIEKNLLKEVTMKVAQHEGHGLTWLMVVERWYSTVTNPLYIQKSYNPATILDYRAMMYNWTKDWLNRPAEEITRGEGRQVLERVIKEGRTKAFQKRLKNTINMIYNWAIEERIIRGVHQSPVYGVQITVIEDRRPEILKLDEIRKLLYEAKVHKHEWYPIWAFALLTGMRSGELYALRWSDVDLENSAITVQRSFNKRMNDYKSTKAGYWRTVPISSELRELISELRQKAKTEFVLPRFCSWTKGEQARILKKFCTFVHIQPIKFHTLRACFATQLISDGAEGIKVMKICGWRDLKTMARYLRLAGVDEKGVTENLHFLPSEDAFSGKVVSLFSRRKE